MRALCPCAPWVTIRTGHYIYSMNVFSSFDQSQTLKQTTHVMIISSFDILYLKKKKLGYDTKIRTTTGSAAFVQIRDKLYDWETQLRCNFDGQMTSNSHCSFATCHKIRALELATCKNCDPPIQTSALLLSNIRVKNTHELESHSKTKIAKKKKPTHKPNVEQR